MTVGIEPSSAARRSRRPQLTIEHNCVSGEANSKKKVSLSATTPNTAAGPSFSASFSSNSLRLLFEPFRRCLWKVLVGGTSAKNATAQKRNGRSGAFSVVVRRMVVVLCFLSVYFTVYQRLEEIERRYDLGYKEHQQQQQQQQSPEKSAAETRSNGNNKNNNNNTLAHYLTVVAPAIANVADAASVSTNPNPSLENARKGREPILSILEDAGIDEFDAKDVLRLPLWSSVSELYYNNGVGNHLHRDHDHGGGEGPVILGLEGCSRFRERVLPRDRFLGVAGNFNSGTTAFGISLQKNCRFAEHPSSKNFVVRRRRNAVVASNVNGMLSQVPWAKHKTAEYRHGDHTILPPSMEYSSIDHDHVLPIVLVRDPFYWMQSMCKEGYGVRWDHDSNHHCPNLIPNEFDRKRFPPKQLAAADGNVVVSSPIPVWMGANPTAGPTWPSLIHYWNAWYESYYYNYNSNNNKINNHDSSNDGVGSGRAKIGVDNDDPSSWPRLIIRFEDTLFYPKQVMEEVCHCGGGKLLSERSSSSSGNKKQHQLQHDHDHDYTFEEAKPDHKHQQKNNFVTAMIEYGTNFTRLRNMTDEDVRFAIESLNPTLMQAFGYSYPNTDTHTNPQQH